MHRWNSGTLLRLIGQIAALTVAGASGGGRPVAAVRHHNNMSPFMNRVSGRCASCRSSAGHRRGKISARHARTRACFR